MGGGGGSANRDTVVGMDAEVASLVSTAWVEKHSRVFLSTTVIPVKFEENNYKMGYSWANDI